MSASLRCSLPVDGGPCVRRQGHRGPCLHVPSRGEQIVRPTAAPEKLRDIAVEAVETLHAAIDGLIGELEGHERDAAELGRPVYRRQLVADGHHRLEDIMEFRDTLGRLDIALESVPKADAPGDEEGR